MPTRDCSQKEKWGQSNDAKKYFYGATKPSHFVMERRDISPDELEKMETLFANRNVKK